MTWIYSRAMVEAYENCTSLPELVEEFSAANCSDIDASAPSSENPTPKPCWWHDKTMEHSRHSQFGMTYAPLKESIGEDLLTWFAVDFLAKTSAFPETGPVLTESDQVSGQKWQGSLAKYDPATHSLKTAQLSFLEDLTGCCVTLPRWGLMLDGELFQQPMLAQITEGNGFGFLPTPSGTSNHGKNHVSGRLDEWGGSSNPWRGTEIGKVHCASFEEWVMGWPVLFTALTALETAKFQEWRLQHSLY